MITMLFTQTTLLWAQVAGPMHSRHHLQHVQHLQMFASDSAQELSTHDCCRHDRNTASHCLGVCVAGVVSLLPTTAIAVFPFFHMTSAQQTLSLSPDGTHTAVLDRPPRHIA